MAQRKSNILAVIVWVIGLLGCTGFIPKLHTFFLILIIPLFFWLLGNKLAKNHCREYFNVLATGIVIYAVGFAINKLIELFSSHGFDFTLLALFYLAVMCILGLIRAVDNKRFNPVLSVRLFK